jgi:hypothetical protein
VGLSTLVPVLGLAFQQAGASAHTPTGFEATVIANLRRVGIEPTLGSLFAVVTAALWLKGALVLLSKRQVGYTVAWAATDLRLNLLRALLASRWSYYTSAGGRGGERHGHRGGPRRDRVPPSRADRVLWCRRSSTPRRPGGVVAGDRVRRPGGPGDLLVLSFLVRCRAGPGACRPSRCARCSRG